MPSKLQIILGFWLRWVPSEAVRRTKKFIHDKQILGWIAFASFAIGSVSYVAFLGKERAQEHLYEAIIAGLLPALAILVARFIWDFLSVPAEMYASCLKRDVLQDLCRKALALHRAGNDLLQRMRESDWRDSNPLVKQRDEWVARVRELLSGDQENVWSFQFDDITMRGISMIEDVGEPFRAAFRSQNNVPTEKFAVEREMTTRLASLGELIRQIGHLATEAAVVSY